MRRLWGVLVVLLVLAGCTTERVGGEPGRTEAPTGPLDLEIPIEMARATPATTQPPTSSTSPSTPPSTPPPSAQPSTLPDPDGNQLTVEEPFLTITRLEHAATRVDPTSVNWTLIITLTEEDGAVFSRWTEEHTGEQVAMIADGEIVSAPLIQSPIPGREITITAQLTRDEAEALLNSITGR